MNKLVALLILTSSAALAAEGSGGNWSYDGTDGPEHWGELSDDFYMCADGSNRSPVDIRMTVDSELPALVFDDYSSPLREINNGHTIQQNIQPGAFIRIPQRNKNYELKQFHFHSLSEHVIEGKSYAMEMHFFHSDETGKLLVVGVMIEQGEVHPVLNKLWSLCPKRPGIPPSNRSVSKRPICYPKHVITSLTAVPLPHRPVPKAVAKIVLKKPIEASAEQIAQFKENGGKTSNRPIQPHNARLILD